MRVLVAEDDAGLRDALTRGLRENGYVVDAVPDGEAATRYLRSYEYELAVLDWRMPGLTGLDVVRWMRRRRLPTATLMLTARDAPADRVAGLDAGADDYLIKPFDIAELLARMRALQRRPPAVQQPQLVVGDLVFDPATRTVRVGARAPELTATEFGILEMLVRRSPAVVARRSMRAAGVGQRGGRARVQHHRRAPGQAPVQAGRRHGHDRDRPRHRLPDRGPMRRRLLRPGLAHAARVALAASLLVCVVYAGCAAVLNSVISARLMGEIDARLQERIADIREVGLQPSADDDDIDSAPVYLWRAGRAGPVTQPGSAGPRAARVAGPGPGQAGDRPAGARNLPALRGRTLHRRPGPRRSGASAVRAARRRGAGRTGAAARDVRRRADHRAARAVPGGAVPPPPAGIHRGRVARAAHAAERDQRRDEHRAERAQGYGCLPGGAHPDRRREPPAAADRRGHALAGPVRLGPAATPVRATRPGDDRR